MNERQIQKWHQEAVEMAKAKKNSALPLNRRARTLTPTKSGEVGAIWMYHRGTVTLMGELMVRL